RPEVAREAEGGQRVPAARAALRRRAGWIPGEEPPHGRVGAQDRRGVDAARRDLRVRGEDRLGGVQRAGGVPGVERDAGGVDEVRDRIAHRATTVAETRRGPRRTSAAITRDAESAYCLRTSACTVSAIARPSQGSSILLRWSSVAVACQV